MTLNLHPVFTELSGRVALYRGGQPKNGDDWRELVRLGVRRIVKLNATREGTDEMGVAMGLELDERPIAPMAQFPPSEAYLSSIEQLLPGVGAPMGDAPCTLVHCTEGVDRTGLLVARWRVRVCGWTNAAAHDEWVRYGSHRYPGLEQAWRLFSGGPAA